MADVPRPQAVLFDLGGVVVDWDPARLYRKIFAGDETRVQWFLETVCTDAWNTQQDAGRSLAEATELLIGEHPQWEDEIRAFYGRWPEMVAGPIRGTATLLNDLHANGVPLFALSNWSVETFPHVQPTFPELGLFQRVFLSGHLRVAKPDPAFYRTVLREIALPPERLIFIDDNAANVASAIGVGLPAIRFQSAEQTRQHLRTLGLPC